MAVVITPAHPLAFTDVEAAVAHIREKSGAAVLYIDAPPDLPRVVPAGNSLHLHAPEVAVKVKRLTDRMYAQMERNELASARKTYDAIFKLVPGRQGKMLNSYTSECHLALQKLPEMNQLMVHEAGEDFRWLHNRACIRLGTSNVKSSPFYDDGDRKWHKEGRRGEIGHIVCLPQGDVGRRSFCIVPDDNERAANPFPPPNQSTMFEAVTYQQIRARGLMPVEYDVRVPRGKIAVILWDHYCVHGIHPDGVGVQLYMSAADDDKIQWLDKRCRDFAKRKVHTKLHDPSLRGQYYELVQLAWLYASHDPVWPSGKAIPGHGVAGQSHSSNSSKFPGSTVPQFTFRTDGDVEHGPAKRRRLQDRDIQVPELAYSMPTPWIRDPESLDPTQRWRWGFGAKPV